MAAALSSSSSNSFDHLSRTGNSSNFHSNGGGRRRMSLHSRELDSSSGPPVAHTLTACTRCRTRKTRCDVGLPRCTPCERSNAVCEYYDSNKGHNVSRSYVVYLQHRVHDLELELQRVENDDAVEDTDFLMGAAAVKMHEAKESKYLGPSSGIAITRLVMQLAKRFTDASSIKDIVPEQRAIQIKELYNQEQAKPTSKIYPLISDVPAMDLPNRELVNAMVWLYKLRVQSQYPALHEPSLDVDIAAVFDQPTKATPYQHFVCRMVIAISLQKAETRFAGLADSYYLAALQYLEPVVKAMDLKTLQCFCLMGEYSLLTPTRTAIYYVVGIAVRLVQALGYHEEKGITRPMADGRVDLLEIDMRRRMFWCVMVMEFGLAHSLGRPAILATRQEHLDGIGWFETCEDEFITPNAIDPRARPTVKKWVAIHFFKMRLLQLEIRRKLYLRKRPTPRSDKDRWFVQMHAKLKAWKDAAPSADESFGLDNIWFFGRYNTMVVFLFRPSPQVPRPSLEAALLCYEACEYNVYMQRDQMIKKVVDLTWAFTQSLFMAINTMLWALSYDEVRRRYKREAVEEHLQVAMEGIELASARWPGVASAIQLYQNLIVAIMKIYEKDGDVPISAASPSTDTASPGVFVEPLSRSRATSPATASSSSVATPPDHSVGTFNYLPHPRRNTEQSSTMEYQNDIGATILTSSDQHATRFGSDSSLSQVQDPTGMNTAPFQQSPPEPYPHQQSYVQSASNFPQQQPQQPQYFDPYHQYNALPDFNPEIPLAGWTPQQTRPSLTFSTPGTHQQQNNYSNAFQPSSTTTSPTTAESYASHPAFNPMNPAYPFPSRNESDAPTAFADPLTSAQLQDQNVQPLPNPWVLGPDPEGAPFGAGLTYSQQAELMRSLESTGMDDIQSMISSTLAAIGVKGKAAA